MTDLKPCPFCGGKIIKFTSPLKNTQMFVCHKCGADVCFYGAEYEPKASKAWNRRAETVKDQPVGDVVEVVRCKDCKHLMFSDCYGECRRNHLGIVRPDDFCSYGERKVGENNA